MVSHADAEAQAQRAQQYQDGNAVELRELVHQDSATTSNIFCKELTPAKIMAIYRMMAKS